MPDWLNAFGLAGSLCGLGAAFDLLMFKKSKGALHRRVTSYWKWLGDTHIPDLPRRLAKGTVDLLYRIIGKKWFRSKCLLIFTLISCALTYLSFYLGLNFERWVFEAWGMGGELATIFHVQTIERLLFVNWFFDLLTLIVTFKVLQLISSAGKLMVMLLAILADFSIALIFAILCLSFASLDLNEEPEFSEAASSAFTHSLSVIAAVPDFLDITVRTLQIIPGEQSNIPPIMSIEEKEKEEDTVQVEEEPSIRVEVVPGEDTQEIDVGEPAAGEVLRLLPLPLSSLGTSGQIRKMPLIREEFLLFLESFNARALSWSSEIFYAATTLIPTWIYLSIMILLFLAKFIGDGLKKVLMWFFERVAQDKPEEIIPFTLSMTYFGILFLMVKLVHYVLFT